MMMAQNRVLASSQVSRRLPDSGFAITCCFRSGFSMRPGSRGVPPDHAIRVGESHAGRSAASGGGDRAALTEPHGSVSVRTDGDGVPRAARLVLPNRRNESLWLMAP